MTITDPANDDRVYARLEQIRAKLDTLDKGVVVAVLAQFVAHELDKQQPPSVDESIDELGLGDEGIGVVGVNSEKVLEIMSSLSTRAKLRTIHQMTATLLGEVW